MVSLVGFSAVKRNNPTKEAVMFMSRVHKLVAGFVLAAFLLGVAVLLAPVPALAAPPGGDDPNCKRACPPTKRHNGFTCTFVGCDPASGLCIYAC